MDSKFQVHVKCLVCLSCIYIITYTWAYTIMKNRQNMCITQRKGEHTCFACEESASNWASNDTLTIQIEGGQNYTKEDHSFQELYFKLRVV